LLRDNDIRYRIFIVHSETDSSQLNLPHCTITEKNNDKKLKNKNKKFQKYQKQTRSHGVSPEERVCGGNNLKKR